MARRFDGVPKLIIRSDIAAFFGVDRRRQYLRNLRPVAFVEFGGKQIDLFDGTLLSAVAVNLGEHPLEIGTPEL